MKKCFRFIVMVLLVLAVLPLSSFAMAEVGSAEEIIYLDNGSYITIELVQMESRASGTKTASKTYTYRNSSGAEQWKAVLRGTFSYTGSSAICTAASCDVTITDTSWYVVSKTATKSGSSATSELTMGEKFLGITIGRESISMKLTCDVNGNLS